MTTATRRLRPVRGPVGAATGWGPTQRTFLTATFALPWGVGVLMVLFAKAPGAQDATPPQSALKMKEHR